jgi:hypothetical protein
MSHPTENLDRLIFGARPIAEALGLVDENGVPDARKVYYLHSKGYLTAVDKVGRALQRCRRHRRPQL